MLVLTGALAVPQAREFKASTSPMADAVRSRLAASSKNLIASAELMPADKYSYHPTPAQMTFGQLMAHIVQTNIALCSAIAGTTPPDLWKVAEADGKDALVRATAESFAYCTEALSKVEDSQLAE